MIKKLINIHHNIECKGQGYQALYKKRLLEKYLVMSSHSFLKNNRISYLATYLGNKFVVKLSDDVGLI